MSPYYLSELISPATLATLLYNSMPQAHSHSRAFARTLPSAWNVPSPDTPFLAESVTTYGSLPNYHFLSSQFTDCLCSCTPFFWPHYIIFHSTQHHLTYHVFTLNLLSPSMNASPWGQALFSVLLTHPKFLEECQYLAEDRNSGTQEISDEWMHKWMMLLKDRVPDFEKWGCRLWRATDEIKWDEYVISFVSKMISPTQVMKGDLEF